MLSAHSGGSSLSGAGRGATADLRPTQPHERILALDVLRSVALLGIVLVNVGSFTSTKARFSLPLFDDSATWVVEYIFSGKFNALFNFVFGIGFAVQLQRLSEQGRGFFGLYVRRLVVLFVFGIAHALLIWAPDVLHVYAILGAILMLCRRATDRLILGLICFLLIVPSVVNAYLMLTSGAASFYSPDAVSRLAERQWIYFQGTYLEVTHARVQEMKETYSQPQSYLVFPKFFLTMLMGFYVGRKGYLQEAHRHGRFLKKTQIWSFLIGSICTIVSLMQPGLFPSNPTVTNVLATTLYTFSRAGLMVFYATTVVRLCQSKQERRALDLLSFAGRMPLTNYLLQSVILTSIFYGYGFGLYRQIGPTFGLLVAGGIFALQIPLSAWWFRGLRFGPMEWLLRSLSYGRAPRLRTAAV